MSRIYPDWVGPTTEYRTASRFPHWINLIGDVLPSLPEGFNGGVIVIANAYDVMQSSVAAGVEMTAGMIKAEVLSNQYSVVMVPKVISAIIAGARVAIDQLASRLGYKTSAKEGAEVTKDRPGVE